MAKRLFDIISEELVSDGWGLDYWVRLKKDTRDGSFKLVIASTGGRWFIFIPPEMWPQLKKAVERVLGKRAGPNHDL